MPLRVVSRKVEDGRVAFNQVVMEQQPVPAGILLVAIEPDKGVYVWLRSHEAIAPHTATQHRGYSRMLSPFPLDVPPSFLGDPVFFPKEEIEEWDQILEGRTNTLNREIRRLFGIVS